MKRLFFAAVVLAAAACGNAETAGPGPTLPPTTTTTTVPGPEAEQRALLETARTTWTANRPDRYRYTFGLACECDGGPWTVEIDGTTLVDVGRPGPDGPGDNLPYTTVESIFEDIEATLDDGLVPVEVLYDPILGYPVSYTWNGPELPVDGGFVLTVSEFEADPSPVDPVMAKDLREARRLWESWGWVDYDYVFTRGCFCPREWVGPYAVRVRSGEVAGASYDGTDLFDIASLEIGRYDEIIKTVPGVFGEIERALREADHVDATYHAEYGYPTAVYIDWDLNTADEEVSYTIAGVREPLPTLDSCSTAGVALELADQPGLPEAVAETRRAIFEAAMRCDISELAAISAMGDGIPVETSFGGSGPEYFLDDEERGIPALRTLVEHLNLPFGVFEESGAHVWPSAFVSMTSPYGDGIPAEEYEALLEMYTVEGLEESFEFFDGYALYRIVVAGDGEWLFAISGD